MILDDLLQSPSLRRVLNAGEERVGKVLGRLLASEAVTSGLQGLVSSAVKARDGFDRVLERALRATNLPSRTDLEALRHKLEELEATLEALAAREAPRGRRDGAAGGGERGGARAAPDPSDGEERDHA
ncbi:MAG TPA: hypothetical protein VFG59_08175 [Anaeromyxobacter sp.]|nr:hypothetical protein [Anaeromyxobacter sp.]